MLGQSLDILWADELVVVWGPDVYDMSTVGRSSSPRWWYLESHTTIWDPKEEKNYTYRRVSGWACLDPRLGRRAYSAIPRKSQWSPNKGQPSRCGGKQAKGT